MRILIADDEYLVRSTLASMLEELGMVRTWIDEVTNGSELLQQIDGCYYDMAFVDIHMPNMDGIRAIQQAKEKAPHTKWVIVTGYSEFTYAQQAIQLGVSNYLLKPISIHELSQVFLSLLQENKRYAMMLNQQFESELNGINREFIYSNHTNVTWPKHVRYISFCLFANSFNRTLRKDTFQKILMDIQEKIKRIIIPNIRLVFLNTTGMDVTVIGAWGFLDNHDEAMLKIEYFYKSLKVIMKKYHGKGMDLTLIRSYTSDTLEENFKFLQQIRNLSNLRILSPQEQLFTLDNLKTVWEKASDKELKLVGACSDLLESFYLNKYLVFMGHIDTINRLIQNDDQLARMLQKYLSPILRDQYINEDVTIIEQLNQIGRHNFVKRNTSTDELNDSIEQVKRYIQKNYMHNIGINQIAEQLNLTPNYLSTLFKKREGITFMKYLTKTRMLIAKELLAQSNVTVSQVANQVGFSSTRHFSKLFKNCYNMYPSELKHKV